jgi:hypothetical protein
VSRAPRPKRVRCSRSRSWAHEAWNSSRAAAHASPTAAVCSAASLTKAASVSESSRLHRLHPRLVGCGGLGTLGQRALDAGEITRQCSKFVTSRRDEHRDLARVLWAMLTRLQVLHHLRVRSIRDRPPHTRSGVRPIGW